MDGSRQQIPNPKKNRRGYSLSTFLICVTIFSISLGWITTTANQQRTAKEELQRQRVSVMYEHEWQYTGKPRSMSSRLLEPIARHVDADLVLPVTVVRTRYLESHSLAAGVEYTPSSVIAPISNLPHLQSLSLTHSDVANKDIAKLSHLSKLEELDLHMTRMHEGSIPGLDQLRLKSLHLNRTRINDESLAALKTMITLEHLDLTRTKVTDAGLTHVASLPNLRKLVLRRTLVSKSGYEAFMQAHPKIDVSWEPLR